MIKKTGGNSVSGIIKTIKEAKQRTEADKNHLRLSVSEIISNVIERGDEALLEYNKNFDLCQRQQLRV